MAILSTALPAFVVITAGLTLSCLLLQGLLILSLLSHMTNRTAKDYTSLQWKVAQDAKQGCEASDTYKRKAAVKKPLEQVTKSVTAKATRTCGARIMGKMPMAMDILN